MLGCSARKNASHLTYQNSFKPEASSSVKELAHLTTHVPETGWSPKYYGIVITKLISITNRHTFKYLLSFKGPHLSKYFVSECFRDPLHNNLSPVDLFYALNNRLCHLVDMTIHGIV